MTDTTPDAAVMKSRREPDNTILQSRWWYDDVHRLPLTTTELFFDSRLLDLKGKMHHNIL
jgi:hypothetical protein